MTKEVEKIEYFYNNVIADGEVKKKERFVTVKIGINCTYMYLMDDESVSFVKKQIGGNGIRRKIAAGLFSLGTKLGRLSSYLPRFSSTTIEIPSNHSIDVALLSMQIRLFDFENEIVHTIPYADPGRVTREIEARSNLPESICTPELVSVSQDYPFLSQKFIKGEGLQSPVKDFSKLSEAIHNISELHKYSELKTKSTTKLLEEAAQNVTLSCKQRIKEKAKDLGLPEVVSYTRIHGDFHCDNIVVDAEGDIFIIDWEKSDYGYRFTDILHPFVRAFQSNNQKSCITSWMMDFNSPLWKLYENVTGNEARDSRGILVLHLLLQLQRTPEERPEYETYMKLLQIINN